MRPLTLADLVAAVDGTPYDGDARAVPATDDTLARPVGPDVVLDSRAITADAVFWAVPGDHVDGHTFVATALAAGAATAVVAHDRLAVATAELDPAARVIAVPDVRAALGRLARRLVDDAHGRGLRVVGITGSMGKTSTKDLLGTVLEGAAPTIAPRSSFNNEWGLPLTATRIDDATRYLVSEMGARGIGHIRYLCELTPPDVGVVLNVAHAHIGEFGSQQAIAQAKGELVEALAADGRAVLNAADPLVRAMAPRTRAPIVWFSPEGEPDTEGEAVWADEIVADDWERHRFTLVVRTAAGTVAHPVGLQTPGRHQVGNAVAAAAAAHAVGLPADRIAAALDGAALQSRWRMELGDLPGGGMLLNDAYNANPEAMVAALDTASRIAERTGRRWGVVLGDMLELGEEAVADHRAVGAAVAEHGAAWAVLVGDHADDLAVGARSAGMADPVLTRLAGRDHAHAAADELRGETDLVLVKASRGVGLELVAASLAATPPGSAAGRAYDPRRADPSGSAGPADRPHDQPGPGGAA